MPASIFRDMCTFDSKIVLDSGLVQIGVTNEEGVDI